MLVSAIASVTASFVLSAILSSAGAVRYSDGVPVPSPAQLNYQRQEIVALTHFNMATFFRDGDPACDASNWAESQKPSSFAPTNLNISDWIVHYKAIGAKSAILTAKHGCGFLLWPTSVTLPNGENYGYHVGGKGGIGIDVAKEFVSKMQAAGMPHSFYYSLKDSFYLNANGDNVLPAKNLLPGQINVTQDEFEDISVAAVTELWSKFGDLTEIWFDGGISDRIKGKIVPLLNKLQPNAICMGAGIENSPNEVDWVGTETGMPKYPVWSTGCNKPGAGSTGVSPESATNFCPKCGDCTLQSPDHWFFMPGTPIKSLAEMIDMYHGTVGQNAVMELDFAIDRTGGIDPEHSTRYFEFGNWIRACYDKAVGASSWQLTNSVVLDLGKEGATIDRVIVQEDLSRGQRITGYTVEVLAPKSSTWETFTTGSSVGHKHISIADHSSTVAQIRLNVTGGVALPANVSISAFAPCPRQ
eukprot:m.1637621 g.1637621  ORF g.1637621 m.1637621 type:complete len:471 (+) comp25984_c0_seq1:180-1592(+)